VFLPLETRNTENSNTQYRVNIKEIPNNSNRCSFCTKNVVPLPTLPNIPTIGIDMIALDIPLVAGVANPKDFLSTIKNTIMGRWGNKATTTHQNTGAKIHWRLLLTSWSIRMEFNPARILDPDGYSLASPSSLSRVTKMLIEEYFLESEDSLPVFLVDQDGSILVDHWPDNWESAIRIGRLDVSADFDITQDWFHEGLLTEIQSKYSKGSCLINNHGTPNTWTSVYSNRDGYPKFYNKTNELKKKGKDTPNVIHRFEYRLEKKSLRKLHIHNLGDIRQDKFEQALRFGWEYSNLGNTIYEPNGWIKEIVAESESVSDPLELIGYLLLSELGMDIQLDKDRKAKLTAGALTIGINPRKRLDRQKTSAYRLDLDTQSLVQAS